MGDTTEQNVWYKIRYTPIRDALRGRITARMDLRRHLEASAPPAEIRQLIHRVVKQTGLWRLEKLDVMHELISHFADGLASGASIEDLIKAFGDERQAAKLIGRAKRRNRSLHWQALRAFGWSMAALLVFYSGFAIYFFSGKPTPRIDYVARLNQTLATIPTEDRAWPMYRQALLRVDDLWRQSWSRGALAPQPGTSEWARLEEIVSQHQSELEWIRQGAARPAFGFVLGARGSAYDPELWPDRKAPQAGSIADSELCCVALPPFRELRNLSALLQVDAAIARRERDRKRLLSDVNSLLGLSRQLGQSAPLLTGLVSLSIYEKALDEIELTLRQDPSLIKGEEWSLLAHHLSTPKVAGDLISVDMERMSFEDMLQHDFTDDGSGSGRLTAEGVRRHSDGPITWQRPWIEQASLPLAGLLVGSRQSLAKEHARLMDRAKKNLMLPLREANWQSVEESLASRTPSLSSVNRNIRFPIRSSAYRHSQEQVERYLGRRDGILVGIALEIFRRQHGNYPETLDALVPELLPEVPADRITGEPVRYRLVESLPVVYSLGVDRDDDGGHSAPAKFGWRAAEVAAQWDPLSDPIPDGDWRLYPALE